MSRYGAEGSRVAVGGLAIKPPVVILVEPQLGENIGMVARAMGNFGWHCLRLVRPRDGWPNAKAGAAASGAGAIIEEAELFETVEGALADLSLAYATSARAHDLAKPVIGPQAAARSSCALAVETGKSSVGYVFGREASGLTNGEVALCDAILTLPVDPKQASLNLAQAVLICAYEWRGHAQGMAGLEEEAARLPIAASQRSTPATKEELQGMYDHLEGLLSQSGFFHPQEKREGMVNNLRSIFARAGLNAQELRTLRGVFSSLDRVHERVREKRDRQADVLPGDKSV